MDKALENLVSMKSAEIESKFHKNFSSVFNKYETISTNNSIKVNNPNLILQLIWENEDVEVEKLIHHNFASLLSQGKGSLEGVVYFIATSQYDEVSKTTEFDENLRNLVLSTIDADHEIPVFVYNLPTNYVAYTLFQNICLKDDKDRVRYYENNVINTLYDINGLIRSWYSDQNRFFLDNKNFKKTDIKKIRKLIFQIWEEIISGQEISSDHELVIELSRYGEQFTFDSDQLLSIIETQLIDIVEESGHTDFRIKSIEKRINTRYLLSLSVLDANSLIYILTAKGYLITERSIENDPTSSTKYKLIGSSHLFDEIKELETNFNKLNGKITPKIEKHELLGVNINFHKGSAGLEADLAKLEIPLSEINDLASDIISEKKSKEMNGENLLYLAGKYRLFKTKKEAILSEFDVYLSQINSQISKQETIISLAQRLSNRIIDLGVDKEPYITFLHSIAEKTDQQPIPSSISGELNNEFEKLDRTAADQEDLKRDRKQLNQETSAFEDSILQIMSICQNIEPDELSYLFEEKIVKDLLIYKDFLNYPKFNKFLVFEDLPVEKSSRLIFKDYILGEIKKHKTKMDKLAEHIYKEVQIIIRDYSSYLDWLCYRGSKEWDQWRKVKKPIEKLRTDLNKLSGKISEVVGVSSNDLQLLFNLKSQTEEHNSELFKENAEIILMIGKNGKQKEFSEKQYIKKFGKENVRDVLNKLRDIGLIVTSYTT